MLDARSLIGTHDALFITLDTLRYDVARDALADGRTPNLAALLPGGAWEERHSPGNFTYAAHHAFFAGFLPTPISPGPHPRLFAARFEGSETIAPQTCVFDAPDIVTGLAQRGYHTVCIGGVGFFNKQNPLGRVLPGLFAESHWSPRLGVTDSCSTENQARLAVEILARLPKTKRVFLFINVSALHQPNRIFLPGAERDCNLFTTANPPPGFAQDYLSALRRQAARTREALGQATFARLAVGGGTPTYLDEASLESLFDVAEQTFGVDPQNIPVSVETSPLTAEAGKLRLLRERGVDRISIGVQSFIEAEVKAVGRSQKAAVVEQALDRIRNVGFPTLNIDLIYGLPGQTTGSWLESLRAALRFKPEELYLYPLYVRPLTGLGRRGQKAEDDLRLACYRSFARALRGEMP